jgi:thioredoxin reductase (NADPH)
MATTVSSSFLPSAKRSSAARSLFDDHVEHIEATDNQVQIKTCKGESLCFDIVYPSLGSQVCSQLGAT